MANSGRFNEENNHQILGHYLPPYFQTHPTCAQVSWWHESANRFPATYRQSPGSLPLNLLNLALGYFRHDSLPAKASRAVPAMRTGANCVFSKGALQVTKWSLRAKQRSLSTGSVKNLDICLISNLPKRGDVMISDQKLQQPDRDIQLTKLWIQLAKKCARFRVQADLLIAQWVVPKVFDSTLCGNVVSRYWKGVFLIPIPSESDRIECERSFMFLHFCVSILLLWPQPERKLAGRATSVPGWTHSPNLYS